ncbi:hypothetical protein GEMRC1_007300 [Eukaryota sp. GEM-RC1]
MRTDNTSNAKVLLLKCPNRLFPSSYKDLLNPFVTEIIDYDTPTYYVTSELYLGVDTEPVYCFKGRHELSWCPALTVQWRKQILSYLKIKESQEPESSVLNVLVLERHYVNRQMLSFMNKTNRSVFVKALEHHNVTVKFQQMEVLSLKHQLTAAFNTDVIIGAHGAGLVWSLFQPSLSSIIVLYPPGCYNYVYNVIPNRLNRPHYFYHVLDVIHRSEEGKSWLYRHGYPYNRDFFKKLLCNRRVRDVDLVEDTEKLTGLTITAVNRLRELRSS